MLFYVSPLKCRFNRTVIKPLRMLLSTATEAGIRITVVHDSFVRTRHLTASVDCMVTVVTVKRAHNHSVVCGLAFLSIYRNLCVTVVENMSGHKSEHKSSCQRCCWSSPYFPRNQILLKQCYLCRKQQPPCRETATPRRTQSTLICKFKVANLTRFKLELWF